LRLLDRVIVIGRTRQRREPRLRVMPIAVWIGQARGAGPGALHRGTVPRDRTEGATVSRAIKVKTPIGDDVFRFDRMSGHEKLSSGFEYQLSVLSEKHDLDLSVLLGQAITIEVELPTTGYRYFNGHVVSFSMDGESSRFVRYHMVLRPWTYLMSLGANCRVFKPATVPELVKDLLAEWKFTDIRDALSDSYRTLDYVVQYRESDFNFISRLMEREGIYYFFEHADGKHTLVLADSSSAHNPAPGYEEVTYFAPGHDQQHHDDSLSRWASRRQVRSGKFSSTDFDPTRVRVSLLKRSIAPKPQEHDDIEVYDYPGDYPRSPESEKDDVKAREGQHHVDVRLEEHQADFETAQASGTVQGLFAGGLFKLVRHPRADQNKKYLVVSASYDLAGNAHEGEGGSGMSFEGSYTCLGSEVPYRAPCDTPRPKVDGPQTAIVVGPAGQEIWTDSFGRVKVQFHWDQLGSSDEHSSCWVRVAQIWAGAGWGAMHIPRIKQEVIVDFLEGDPDRPIITGRVYNNVNMPPYPLPDNKTQSGIKSRSTLGGTDKNFNEIRFEDLKGKEELFVQAERNHTVKVKANRHLSVGGSEIITVGGTRTTTVTGKDDVTLKDEHVMTVTKLASQYFNDGHVQKVYGHDQDVFVDKGKTEYVTKRFSMESKEKIILTVGASTVTITPDKIDLKATTVSINGATLVDVVGGLIKLNS
jgi:type VI secretion system secreted protein VgrG